MPYLFGKVNGLISKIAFHWEMSRKGPNKDKVKKVIKKHLKAALKEIKELNNCN